MRLFLMALLLLWPAAWVSAQTGFEMPEDQEAASFISNEVLATFYHELGHAFIDVLGLPVLGKEEDAADHLSVILMNEIWQEDSAAAILASDATAYALQAEQVASGGGEPAYADEHSLDMQRYYTVVCPVSYTHLDVYKRQRLQRAGLGEGARPGGGCDHL